MTTKKIEYYKLQDLERESFTKMLKGAVKGIESIVSDEFGEGITGLSKVGDMKANIKETHKSWKNCNLDNISTLQNAYLCTPIVDTVFLEDPTQFFTRLFKDESLQTFLSALAHVDPFSDKFSDLLCNCSGDATTDSGVSTDSTILLDQLACLKKLKYFLNLPMGQILQLLSELCKMVVMSDKKNISNESTDHLWIFVLANIVNELFNTAPKSFAHKLMLMQFKTFVLEDTNERRKEGKQLSDLEFYRDLEMQLEKADPHATFPTSIYRRCDGRTFASQDAQTIEATMGTVLTTTIKITRNVLNPKTNHLLASVYRPLGRVVAIVDDKVDNLGYSDELRRYFKHFKLDVTILVFGGNEVDKDMSTVENILIALKANNVSRNLPVLIVGGGVLSDTAGLACALYHRNTPYVMLCTSIVSGIDAGPSPRTCCDGFGYKNLYGAYHPPVLTLTDRMFWKSMRVGWVRHGIAEIIKMAVVKDLRCFELLEQGGNLLVKTKFGSEMELLVDKDDCTDVDSVIDKALASRGFSDQDHFQQVCDEIVGRAMEGYVRSEYGNLWETHQARPHAYGHTWSPGYELPAGMLHGHAVATCMGYGAFMACYHWECQNFVEETDVKENTTSPRPWLPESQMFRILDLINEFELALYHDIMDNVDVIWSSQVKMTAKRGGNLAAPVPKGVIGKCGFINNVDKECLRNSLKQYKDLVTGLGENSQLPRFKRHGYGVEVQCHDVGLEDPSTVIKPGDILPEKKVIASNDTLSEVTKSPMYLNENTLSHLESVHKPSKFESSNTTSKTGTTSASSVSSPEVEDSTSKSSDEDQPKSYQEWIKQVQSKRHQNSAGALVQQYLPTSTDPARNDNLPPAFPYSHLFADGSAEGYALKQTTPCSPNVRCAAQITDKHNMFMPCMVGALESQFLKMTANLAKAKRILDVGTFTGNSAIAFADSSPDCQVTTMESDEKTAEIAQEVFDACTPDVGKRIKLMVGNAQEMMWEKSNNNEQYDLIFLDADKENYENYYALCMGDQHEDAKPLLAEGGVILADNTACALLYDENDDRRNALHRFNRKVSADERVEQVLLTIREGITMIKRKTDMTSAATRVIN